MKGATRSDGLYHFIVEYTFSVLCALNAQGLVTIHENILSMHQHVLIVYLRG